jgi:hypothetical protein
MSDATFHLLMTRKQATEVTPCLKSYRSGFTNEGKTIDASFLDSTLKTIGVYVPSRIDLPTSNSSARFSLDWSKTKTIATMMLPPERGFGQRFFVEEMFFGDDAFVISLQQDDNASNQLRVVVDFNKEEGVEVRNLSWSGRGSLALTLLLSRMSCGGGNGGSSSGPGPGPGTKSVTATQYPDGSHTWPTFQLSNTQNIGLSIFTPAGLATSSAGVPSWIVAFPPSDVRVEPDEFGTVPIHVQLSAGTYTLETVVSFNTSASTGDPFTCTVDYV